MPGSHATSVENVGSNSRVTTLLQNVHSDVVNYGVSIVQVIGDDDKPCVSYTIGLQISHNHPDLFMCDVEFSVAKNILNAVVTDYISVRPPLVDQQVLKPPDTPSINRSFDLRVHEFTDPLLLQDVREEMTQTGKYYFTFHPSLPTGTDFPVMQILIDRSSALSQA
jgi:hypothetical protein